MTVKFVTDGAGKDESRSQCGFCGSPVADPPFDVREFFPKIYRKYRSMGVRSTCIICIDYVLEQEEDQDHTLVSLYKDYYIAELDTHSVTHRRLRSRMRSFIEFNFGINNIDLVKLNTLLEIILYVVKYAKDDFADQRRKMVNSILQQAFTRQLSQKQRNIFQYTLNKMQYGYAHDLFRY